MPDRKAFQPLARAFHALADPTRLAVLEVLSNGEHCVCRIQEELGDIPANLLSHHLRVLREAGLVGSKKKGRWVHYWLNEEKLEALRKAIPRLKPGAEKVCNCGPPRKRQRRT